VISKFIFLPSLAIKLKMTRLKYTLPYVLYFLVLILPHDGKTDDGMIDDGMIDDGKTDDGMIDDGKTDDGMIDDGKTDDGMIDDGMIDDGMTDDRFSNNDDLISPVKMAPMKNPFFKWSKVLPASSIEKGNEVQYKYGIIFVNSLDCGIDMLDIDGNLINHLDGTSETCHSGLAFPFSSNSEYFVQSRQNKPEDKTDIVAFQVSGLKQKWKVQLDGLTEGSPIISSDNNHIFCVSNSQSKTKAHFSIIDNQSGKLLDTETFVPSHDRNAAYAPLSVARKPVRGNWAYGGKNSNDMLIWGELYIEERGLENSEGTKVYEGTIHFYQLPSKTNFVYFDKNDPLLSSGIGSIENKVTLSGPVVFRHGQGAIFSFNAGHISGFSEGVHFGLQPTLEFQLEKQLNNNIPSHNSGTLVSDNFWIIPGPPGLDGMPYIQGMEIIDNIFSRDLKIVWKIVTTNVIQSRPKLAFNPVLAYYIDGQMIVCIDAISGDEKWTYDAGAEILAEFNIIDEKYLVYGTKDGVISSIQIGDSETNAPSFVPSSAPSTSPSKPPSFTPSLHPTISTHPSLRPSFQPSKKPSSNPSSNPSVMPSSIPSTRPSQPPSSTPSLHPTISSHPSYMPSLQPSNKPSGNPSATPSSTPSTSPSKPPSSTPSLHPTISSPPSHMPSLQPSDNPSSNPSVVLFSTPSTSPSKPPSSTPSASLSSIPPSISQPSNSPSSNSSILSIHLYLLPLAICLITSIFS